MAMLNALRDVEEEVVFGQVGVHESALAVHPARGEDEFGLERLARRGWDLGVFKSPHRPVAVLSYKKEETDEEDERRASRPDPQQPPVIFDCASFFRP